MIGDKLVVTEYHRAAARQVLSALRSLLETATTPLGVTVAGESGSGKSETAHCLAALLDAEGTPCVVLGQDDYFRLPPRTNHEKRKTDIGWVGTGEVQLDLLDEHVGALKRSPDAPLEKPEVHFAENRIGTTVIHPEHLRVIVAEGTYTTLLRNADLHAFIDRDYRQNRASRLKRARDPDPEFLERVLKIEHEIIRAHRELADVIIDAPEDERQSG